jgi:hypothetical protein
MIPSWAEVNRGLNGALLLLRRDPSGMALFDLSIEGFWKSFFAIVVAAPAYAVLAYHRWQITEAAPGLGRFASVELVSYLGGWLAFPVAAIFLTRHLGLAGRYVPLIVAVNWAAVLQAAILLGALLVASLAGGGLGTLFLLAAAFGVLLYQWFVVRTALDTTAGLAAMLVAIDMLLSTVVSRGIGAALGGV